MQTVLQPRLLRPASGRGQSCKLGQCPVPRHTPTNVIIII